MEKKIGKDFRFVKHEHKDKIGTCKKCLDIVFESQLFVDDENGLYHFSCLNEEIKNKEDK